MLLNVSTITTLLNAIAWQRELSLLWLTRKVESQSCCYSASVAAPYAWVVHRSGWDIRAQPEVDDSVVIVEQCLRYHITLAHTQVSVRSLQASVSHSSDWTTNYLIWQRIYSFLVCFLYQGQLSPFTQCWGSRTHSATSCLQTFRPISRTISQTLRYSKYFISIYM